LKTTQFFIYIVDLFDHIKYLDLSPSPTCCCDICDCDFILLYY